MSNISKSRTNLSCGVIQWKLWNDAVVVLQSNGEIAIYKIIEDKPKLSYKTEANVMIMYKNPCYMFRDVIFCSTSAAAGLIVRSGKTKILLLRKMGKSLTAFFPGHLTGC